MAENIEQKVLSMKAFIERRTKIFDKIMLNYPEGVTKNNLEQIKKAVRVEENRTKQKKD